jgi:outer membrane lipoprotein SlyB
MSKRLFAILMCLVLVLAAALPASARTHHRRHYARHHYASRTYYTYSSAPRRTFWQKHRDKLTVAGGTLGGALIGGIAGGRKGAGIGALAGAGGSALYTYKLRKRHRRY